MTKTTFELSEPSFNQLLEERHNLITEICCEPAEDPATSIIDETVDVARQDSDAVFIPFRTPPDADSVLFRTDDRQYMRNFLSSPVLKLARVYAGNVDTDDLDWYDPDVFARQYDACDRIGAIEGFIPMENIQIGRFTLAEMGSGDDGPARRYY